MQSRNRDTEIENKHAYKEKKGRVGWIETLGLTYIYTTMYKIGD